MSKKTNLNIGLIVLILFFTTVVEAIGGTYVFLPSQSTVIEDGGLGGIHEIYTIEGQFQLTIDFDVNTASFDHVDANLSESVAGGYGQSLDNLFDMTDLVGIVVSDTEIEFDTADPMPGGKVVHLDLTFVGNSIHLTGGFCEMWVDGFCYTLDALLRRCYKCNEVDIYWDGKINFKDYCLLAANWLKQGPLDGDITDNGIVDLEDLMALAFHWATYCEVPVRKPNIYFYPEETIELDVNVVFPHGGLITTSIPDYNNGWHITVEPSGIIDGQYEFLFYETSQPNYGQYEAGWIVAQEQLEDFFRNNMSQTGFNQKEIDDFIEYWIPRLTEYPYYAIYPQYNDELEEMIKLEFSEQPANLIRLIYSVRGLETDKLSIQEPVIPLFARDGFTVAEWGVILKW